jgi:hypothetical protein
MQQFVDTRTSPESSPNREKLARVKALEIEEKNSKKTRGERLFNAISWVFFGWIVNAAASIKFADTLTTSFRPFFLRNSEKMAKTLPFRRAFGEIDHTDGSKIATEEGQKMARSVFGVIALLPGGFVVLAPIKWMEDSKSKIVRFFDRLIGPRNPSDEQKAAIDARHNYIAQAPTPSMLEMAQGRILPIMGIIGLHFSVASSKTNVINWVSKKLGGQPDLFPGWGSIIGKLPEFAETYIPGVTRIKNWYVPKAQKQIDSIAAGYANSAKYSPEEIKAAYDSASKAKINGLERYNNYVENIGIDFSYSAVVAACTYALSHMLAWKRAEKRAARGESYASAAIPSSSDIVTAAPAPAPKSEPLDAPNPRIDAAQYADRLIDPALVLRAGV